jgi:hypothetical protein
VVLHVCTKGGFRPLPLKLKCNVVTKLETDMTYNLIGVGNNAKTIKGDGSEYMTAIKYMKPFKDSVQGQGTQYLCYG